VDHARGVADAAVAVVAADDGRGPSGAALGALRTNVAELRRRRADEVAGAAPTAADEADDGTVDLAALVAPSTADERAPVDAESARRLAQFDALLDELGLIDGDRAFALAAEAAAAWFAGPGHRITVVVPDETEAAVGEPVRSFLAALPAGNVVRPVTDGRPNVDHLDVRVFRAASEFDEVRTVLRWAFTDGSAFDDVEILYSAADPYVPLLYETAQTFRPSADDGCLLPMTFAEGIPASATRPGLALAGWLDWFESDFQPAVLASAIEHGLLAVPHYEAHCVTFETLAQHFRTMPPLRDVERLGTLAAELEAATERYVRRLETEPDFGVDDDVRTSYLMRAKRRQVALLILTDVLTPLAASAGAATGDGAALLVAAKGFLQTSARAVDEFDRAAVASMVSSIDEVLAAFSSAPTRLTGRAMVRWLRELPAATSVGASAPRTGHVHVAPLDLGGHTGRTDTFVIGLDDHRRRGPTCDEAWFRLLGRLAGRLTSSYTCLDVLHQTERFPSTTFLQAYRQYLYDPDADYATLSVTPPPTTSSFAAVPREAVTLSEWLVAMLCRCSATAGWFGPFDGDVARLPPAASVRAIRTKSAVERCLGASYANVQRGLRCLRAHGGSKLTSWDGLVAPLTAESDPLAPGGKVLSAGALELLARCPMQYFFTHVLHIEEPFSPHEYLTRWLGPDTFDRLLHDVLHRFVGEVRRSGTAPTYEHHWPLLRSLLDRAVTGLRSLLPPPDELVFRTTVDELEETAQLFLLVEEEAARAATPVHLGVAIGTTPATEPTALDTDGPVTLDLGDGLVARFRTYVDRVDRLDGDGTARYAIVDYRTDAVGPFLDPSAYDEGRILRHVVDTAVLQQRLDTLEPGAEVLVYRYFFPRRRDCGRRLGYAPQDDTAGRYALRALVIAASNGAFVQTDDYRHDCPTCPWRPYCAADVHGAARAAAKLDDAENDVLQPLRELRPHGSRR